MSTHSGRVPPCRGQRRALTGRVPWGRGMGDFRRGRGGGGRCRCRRRRLDRRCRALLFNRRRRCRGIAFVFDRLPRDISPRTVGQLDRDPMLAANKPDRSHLGADTNFSRRFAVGSRQGCRLHGLAQTHGLVQPFFDCGHRRIGRRSFPRGSRTGGTDPRRGCAEEHRRQQQARREQRQATPAMRYPAAAPSVARTSGTNPRAAVHTRLAVIIDRGLTDY